MAKEFLSELQVVEIDPKRQRQLEAYLHVILKHFHEMGGNEEARIIFLESRFKDYGKAVYQAAFVDGFLDSTPRMAVPLVFHK